MGKLLNLVRSAKRNAVRLLNPRAVVTALVLVAGFLASPANATPAAYELPTELQPAAVAETVTDLVTPFIALIIAVSIGMFMVGLVVRVFKRRTAGVAGA